MQLWHWASCQAGYTHGHMWAWQANERSGRRCSHEYKTEWTETNLLVNQRCHGQAVEAVRERLPEANVVAAFTFVIEAVNPIDGRALVVAAKQEEVLGILDLRAALARVSRFPAQRALLNE